MPGVLRIGTRRSTLARWQAERVRSLLAARGVRAELVPIATSGDEERTAAPKDVSAKALFTKELEEALLGGRIDLAVHSLKDLLIEQPPGLVLAVFPEREDPRDALVSAGGASLDELPAGARVGTSSARRRAALATARPDLEVVPLRGNVPTRIRRVDEQAVDAAVLALAGLIRLGVAGRARPLDPHVVLPAAGQGALAVQVRAADAIVHGAVAPLDDRAVRTAIAAERAALAGLETGCDVPVGALCRSDGANLVLEVAVYAVDGRPPLTVRVPVDRSEPTGAGRAAAVQLLRDGAAERIRAAQLVGRAR